MTVTVLGAFPWRGTDGGGLGQLLATSIHHATLLATPATVLAVAVAMVGQPLFAALVESAGTPTSLLQSEPGAALRAVLAPIAIALLADDERLVAPLALQDPPVPQQSSVRKLGTGGVARQTLPIAASTAPVEDPVPPCKVAAGSSAT